MTHVLNMDILEFLERGWTQGAMARTKDGVAVSAFDSSAYYFSLNGAVMRHRNNYGSMLDSRLLFRFVHRAIIEDYPNSLKQLLLWLGTMPRTEH